MAWKNWGDHPLVVVLSVSSAIASTAIAFGWIKPSVSSSATEQPTVQVSSSPLPQSAKNPSIGWIRLGAVNHELATLRNGSPLVETTQPITISPPMVPVDGTQVNTVIGVNLRKNPPTPPLYDPDREERSSVLNQPTKLIVLKKVTFVDPKRPSTTVVWGEVALNEN